MILSISSLGIMYRVCGLWLGPNFAVRLVADKNFYLRLTVEEKYAFAVFSNEYLQPYGCNDTTFTAAVNCTNSKTQIISEIIEI